MTGTRRLLIPLLVVSLTLACGFNPNALRGLLSPATPTPDTPANAQRYAIGPASAASGLSQLAGYQANLVVEFEGVRGGEPVAGQIESLTEVTRQPAALHRYLNSSMAIPRAEIAAGTAEFFQIDDKVYVKKSSADPWLTFQGDQVSPESLGFFEFDRLIVLPTTVAGPPLLETLNGLPVEHYVFVASDLDDPNLVFKQAQGDVWIAADDDYLMQYVISATLRVVIPDPNTDLFHEGRLNLRYSLTDINSNLVITPPAAANAQNAPFDELPRLPDAEITSIYPALLEYTSAISAISATLFYREALTAQKWDEEDVQIFNEKSRLSYSKADQRLTVIITPAETPDKIKVTMDVVDR